MLGAIIGDIAGSQYEFNNHKSKEFDMFSDKTRYTDDSVMTLAVANTILIADESNENKYDSLKNNIALVLRTYGRDNIRAGYGGKFKKWILTDNMGPYNSWGNGAAMRISPVGWAGKDLDDVKTMSKIVTEVTHNHPEGIKAAEAVSTTIFLARNGATMEQLKRWVGTYYTIDFTLDEIRPTYKFEVSCMKSVPQAFESFFESNSFEDTIRNAVSIGGDSDTIACIAGGIAEAYYGVPDWMKEKALSYFNKNYQDFINYFEDRYTKSVI